MTTAAPPSAAKESPPRRVAWGAIATLVALAGAIALVIHNGTRHEPTIGYDVGDHLLYAQTLSQWRLPMPQDTAEFFSAPLPYVVPAIVMWFEEIGTDSGWRAMARGWQIANMVYAGVACVALALLVGEASGRDRWGRLAPAGAVAMLATLPVFSRTFAMARPDAMCAAVTTLAALGVIRLCRRTDSRPMRWAACGLLLGLVPLARQWGVLTALPMSAVLTLYAFRMLPFRKALGRLLLTAAVALAAGGWFYLSLQTRFDSVLSFNRDREALTDPASPAPTGNVAEGVVPEAVFAEPVRGRLHGRPGWIFYADFWGDYWLYYNVFGRDRRGNFLAGSDARPQDKANVRGNYDEMVPYLGRVNVVAIVPTLALLAGIAWAASAGARRWWRNPDAAATPLVLFAAIAGTAVGYGWFVLQFAHGTLYDTAKGSYVMHAVPLVVAATALMLAALARRHPRLAIVLIAVLALAASYMLEASMTKYV